MGNISIPKRLTESFEQSLRELFGENPQGLAPEISEMYKPSGGDMEIGSSIAFSSNEINGTLFIASTSEGLLATHPMSAYGVELNEAHMDEWAGELANQALGRFRNLMLRYGIEIDLSLPTVIKGVTLSRAAPSKGNLLFRHVSLSTSASFDCSLLMVFTDGFSPAEIDERQVDESSRKHEGDGFVF